MNAKEKTRFTVKNSPEMFDHIAKRYDKLNRVMTLGMDKKWRKALKKMMPTKVDHWLDAATGTGDQILFSVQHGLEACKITGIDLSDGMLAIGKRKLSAYQNINLHKASLTSIPLSSNSCDVVTCSFGIRNVDPFTEGLVEFLRVLKPGGTMLILESSRPEKKLFRLGHSFYMRYILPKLASFLGSDPEAYTYLANTTSCFPCGQDFCDILKKVGFSDIKAVPMALGAVTVYHAKKS